MVAFSPSNLPSSVNTVEKLMVWGASILQELHFQMEVQESPGVIEKVAVAQLFPTNVNGAYSHRMACRASVPMSGTYLQGGKIWTYAQDLSNASIPASYTTN